MNVPIQFITSPLDETEIAQLDTIEAFFFAYRDFVSDPDRLLSAYEFGRAHHRVLFFVNRQPGLSVAELLETLKITKQSLGRVLRQLIKAGYIIQNEGKNDRRKRQLFPTFKGRELILKLSGPQSERITRACENLSESERQIIANFLTKMQNLATNDNSS